MDQFNQRKKDILSKLDKSSKGDWDERIRGVCEKLNSMNNYYSTSSCSGRIIIMKDDGKKGPGLFEFVSHDLVDFDNFLNSFDENFFCKGKMPTQPSQLQKKFSKKISCGGDLKFKQESVILHVACREIDDARKLLEKGLKAGFKKSGIISLGKNIIVELNLTDKLEFPLMEKSDLLVDKKFLKKVIGKANSNLEKGWKKIEELEGLI